jgi:hypothetical protein
VAYGAETGAYFLLKFAVAVVVGFGGAADKHLAVFVEAGVDAHLAAKTVIHHAQFCHKYSLVYGLQDEAAINSFNKFVASS